MRTHRKRRSSAPRYARRNFLNLERLEDRMVLSGASPVAVNDLFQAVVDQPLSITAPGLLANDTDAEADALTASLFSGPQHGTVDVAEDGSFLYTPEVGYLGLDSFIYAANDGSSSSGLAAVTIQVGTGNTPPVALNDAYATDEGAALNVAASGVLANDTDADADELSSVLASGPQHGSLTMNADGSFSYTPDSGFSGIDGFSYLASDGLDSSTVATVTITVNAVNENPTAVNDVFSTDEDTALTVTPPGVLANDTDPDGDALSAIMVAPPAHGTLTLNPDGSLEYTPEADFNGVDGFSYIADDGSGQSDVASVTITVNPVNDAPTAADDIYVTDEDVELVIAAPGVLTNDGDVDGDALTAALVSGPANGSLVLNADGSFSYTPGAGFSGTDTFSYQSSDGTLSSAPVTVTINVNATNDAPDAVDDAFTIAEDGTLDIDALTGVLVNDTDPDGDALIATVANGPTNGTLVLNSDGSFSYTPNANFNGTDSFTYTASDGGLSDEATVMITVTPENDLPLAVADGYITTEDTVLSIGSSGVLSNDSDIDGDPLTAALVSGPANGSLVLNADGSFDYTPNANFFGDDSFVYAAGDGTGTTEATVTITVTPTSDPPTAASDAYSTGEDVVLAVGAATGVLANDVDALGGPLTAELISGPEHGTLALNADGSFSYTPEADWNGFVTFTYKATGADGEITATATITVQPLNDAPVAADDEFEVTNDPMTPGTGNVLPNDSDIDGDLLTPSVIQGPAHGTVTLTPDGTFMYTPEAGFVGDVTFTYQLSDGLANSNVATVTLHVSDPVTTPPANTAPTAVNDSYTVDAGATLDVLASGVLGNDTDAEGDALVASLFGTGPQHGSIVFNADGSFSYTPEAGYSGLDAFLYSISDGELISSFAAVTLHVLPAATPPAEPEPSEPTDPCDPLGLMAADDDLLDLLASDQAGLEDCELPPCGLNLLA